MKKKEYKRACIVAEAVICDLGYHATDDEVFQYMKQMEEYYGWTQLSLLDETENALEVLHSLDLVIHFPKRKELY